MNISDWRDLWLLIYCFTGMCMLLFTLYIDGFLNADVKTLYYYNKSTESPNSAENITTSQTNITTLSFRLWSVFVFLDFSYSYIDIFPVWLFSGKFFIIYAEIHYRNINSSHGYNAKWVNKVDLMDEQWSPHLLIIIFYCYYWFFPSHSVHLTDCWVQLVVAPSVLLRK